MQIREVMSVKNQGQIYSIAPDALIPEAIKQLVEHGIGSLVVLENGNMVGFITERDIIHGMYARGCALAEAKVAELMEKEPLMITADDSVDYAREAMTKSHTSHLLVMQDKVLLGVISFHDLARAALKDANFENALLKRYIKNWPE